MPKSNVQPIRPQASHSLSEVLEITQERVEHALGIVDVVLAQLDGPQKSALSAVSVLLDAAWGDLAEQIERATSQEKGS